LEFNSANRLFVRTRLGSNYFIQNIIKLKLLGSKTKMFIMSTQVSIIFPNQLFKEHPAINTNRPVYLLEEWHFFNQYPFHKEKLVLHRASMKFYEHFLKDQGVMVHYIESMVFQNRCELLIEKLHATHVNVIHIADPVDNWLLRKIKTSCALFGIELIIYDSPNFLNNLNEVDPFFSKKKTYFQTDFYIWQRKSRNILLEKEGKPLGEKWTFDADNRSKFPKNEVAPKAPSAPLNSYISEAEIYVQNTYPNNYGSINKDHLFAINFVDTETWLEEFLKYRFEKFGIYEDAIAANESVLHHSLLSPMLNIGLITPKQIIERAIDFSNKNNIPLNSLEGFIRQIMGWREFIRIVYEREGSKQRTTNYWKFTRKIPVSFWKGNTGIAPIDLTIKKVLATGYCHHIERLMVLGNFMLLCEFDPDEVYKWFMEMFIDAYDWVMVPNVYGMILFADGGLMTTKPYISGSNYLMKMSDYEKGEWQQIWDGLFWRFMHEHRTFFLGNPRIGMLVHTFDKMNPDNQESHLYNASKFLNELDAKA
jgi:deoxyribodipyrimidine photolyase-related protein